MLLRRKVVIELRLRHLWLNHAAQVEDAVAVVAAEVEVARIKRNIDVKINAYNIYLFRNIEHRERKRKRKKEKEKEKEKDTHNALSH